MEVMLLSSAVIENKCWPLQICPVKCMRQHADTPERALVFVLARDAGIQIPEKPGVDVIAFN
jgi:hypothetical protein